MFPLSCWRRCSDFVGYSVDVNAKSCQFLLPSTLSRIRSPSSASSLRRSLQSLETRLILLARGTRPRSRIPELMHLLLDLYRQKGFTSAQLAPVCFKISDSLRPQSKTTERTIQEVRAGAGHTCHPLSSEGTHFYSSIATVTS